MRIDEKLNTIKNSIYSIIIIIILSRSDDLNQIFLNILKDNIESLKLYIGDDVSIINIIRFLIGTSTKQNVELKMFVRILF